MIGIQVLSNHELKEVLVEEKTTVIDVREEDEYSQGHIRGSLWIPLEDLAEYVASWDVETPLVIICRTVNRSQAACRYLAAMGFTNLAYVVPGIRDWEFGLDKSPCTGLEQGTRPVRCIYLDHAATTPIEPAVASAMWGYLVGGFGNPSSAHRLGRRVRDGIAKARREIARLIGAQPQDIVFTSGGTEADNAALWGVLEAVRRVDASRTRLVTSSVEHAAVLQTIDPLRRSGFTVTVIPVDQYGRVCPDALGRAMDDHVALVSIMYANNEVGTLQEIKTFADIAHRYGAFFHTDAVQAVGYIPIDVDTLGVDALSLSAHKIYGPKGVGALFVRAGIPWESFLHGGNQEQGRRAGTENTSAIVGFGVAAKRVRQRLGEVHRIRELRDRLEERLRRVSGVTIFGHPRERLPNICCFGVENRSGQDLVLDLDIHGIACSSGSACHGGQPSHTLMSMGCSVAEAASSVRISLGWSSTDEEIDSAIPVLTYLLTQR